MYDDPVLLNDWHPVAHIDAIGPDNLTPARVMGVDLVVWRSDDGVHVWQDRCAHRGVKLSLGTRCENRLVCAYHGWEYEPDGVCVRYPAHERQKPSPRARAKTYLCKERYGLVWVCLGEPANEIPAFPEIDSGTHQLYFGGRFVYETSGQRAIENFLDISHFPFVHAGILGDQPHTEIQDYDVEVSDDGVAVTNVKIWQPQPTNTLKVDGMDVGYEYYVQRPLTARLIKDVGVKNEDGSHATEAIILTTTPVEPDRSVGWMLLASNYDEQVDEVAVQAFTEEIISQDIKIVESQEPKLLPLDMGAELHVRSDRTAVEYRRWLKSLGMKFGIVADIGQT